MPADGVTVVIEYRALPGQEGAAHQRLETLVSTVVASEPACSGIEILQDVDDPAHFLLYEQWSSREAYTGPHMRTPHILEFIAQAPGFMAGPPTITFFNTVE